MSKPAKGYCEVPSAPTPQKFVPRDLAKISPTREQFEPTPAQPVRQKYKMAGGA